MLRTSHLDLDVRLSEHPAPENLNLYDFAHVDVVMTATMNRQEVVVIPVIMVAVNVM